MEDAPKSDQSSDPESYDSGSMDKFKAIKEALMNGDSEQAMNIVDECLQENGGGSQEENSESEPDMNGMDMGSSGKKKPTSDPKAKIKIKFN